MTQAIRLSSLPTSGEITKMLVCSLHSVLQEVSDMSLTEKRMCFAGLRHSNSNITAEQVFMPMGVTVGQFAVCDIVMASEKTKLKK